MYWIALDKDHQVIEKCIAPTEDVASWKFAQMQIYPQWVVEIPERVVDAIVDDVTWHRP